MKVVTRTTALLASIVFGTLLCAGQQSSPNLSQTPPPVAVANQVQLVIEGKVVNVHDGDTVTVLDQDGKKFNIRLHGIDAPELKQAYGAHSQQNLSRMVLGKQVTIYWSKIDKYRRTVGTIMLGGRDVNIEQVKAGLAWHFKKYQDEQTPEDRVTYAAAEDAAHTAVLGLWKDQPPLAPSDFRQAVKAKRWGPPPPEGTIIGNRNSLKYHRPDCAGYRDMAEANRVFFKTVAEAEEAGYKRAGNCPAEIQKVAAKPPITASTSAALPSSTVATKPADSTAPSESIRVVRTVATNPNLISVATSQPPNSDSQRVIIGNKNSRVYHLPGCTGYSLVSEKNQVKFQSAADAEKAGFRLAGNCSVKSAQASRN
ncbi:MAG TPA: thermonuclease family protein [Pyrinomonadaceae bacterium]|nr:thermonuclease family protein [Pyrinomonadaceae bacterium]